MMDTYYDLDLLKTNKRSLMRYKILSYTLEQLSRPDFSGLSISGLCKTLGISRTSFYENFSCRRDLFAQALKSLWDELADRHQGLSYRESIVRTVDFIADRKTIIRNMMKQRYTAMDATLVSKFFAQTARREFEVQKNLGRELGFDIGLASAFYAGGFIQIISYWLAHDFKYTNEQVADCLMKIFEGDAGMFILPRYPKGT